jgi:hypothetical protein
MYTRNAIESAVFDVPWKAMHEDLRKFNDRDVWVLVHVAVRDVLPENPTLSSLQDRLVDIGR